MVELDRDVLKNSLNLFRQFVCASQRPSFDVKTFTDLVSSLIAFVTLTVTGAWSIGVVCIMTSETHVHLGFAGDTQLTGLSLQNWRQVLVVALLLSEKRSHLTLTLRILTIHNQLAWKSWLRLAMSARQNLN